MTDQEIQKIEQLAKDGLASDNATILALIAEIKSLRDGLAEKESV